MNALYEYRHPAAFYVLSTAISWSLWLAAAHFSHVEPVDATHVLGASWLGLLWLLSPLAVALAFFAQSPVLRKDLAGRLFRIRGIKPRYLLATGFLMLGSILLAQAISLLFGYPASQFLLAGHFSFSSGVFPVWFLLLVAPAIEELAWHSYGTDCLRSRYNLLVTSLTFAAFWALWHVPLSFIKGYYQSNLIESGLVYALNFPASVLPFVIIMNWLYYKTGRSVLVAVVFHTTAGYFNEIFATHPASKVIQTGLLVVIAAFLVLRERSFFLDRNVRDGAAMG